MNFPNFADIPAKAAKAATSTAKDKYIAQLSGLDVL
jgi:hypothetical protein